MKKSIDLKALLAEKVDGIAPMEGAEASIAAAQSCIPTNLMYDAEATVFRPETKPVGAEPERGFSVEEAVRRENEMTRFIDAALVSGTDYGIIPHCSRPSLLKPGAEKIMNFLGLVARTEIANRTEDYESGFFAYEAKVYLISYHSGAVVAEGVGACNSKESKYAKQNGFAVQNVILKMTKKRALVDAVLNVGNLSARFTQDEDLIPEEKDDSNHRTAPQQHYPTSERPASEKQLKYLTSLMDKKGVTPEVMNRHTMDSYGISDYHQVSSVIASMLIERLKMV